MNESEASIEVCIVVEGTVNVSVLVMSLSNNSAEGSRVNLLAVVQL